MKAGWFILWAVVVWQIAGWAFAPPPKPPQPVASRPVPTDFVEQSAVQSRASTREYVLKALDKPWNARCGEDRINFIQGVSNYYYIRQNQSERYPENYGKAGADYIVKQWSTTDDARIERLTQEAYARGFLKAADFNGLAGKLFAAVVKNERVTGNGCGG